jgi:hypothetical protein
MSCVKLMNNQAVVVEYSVAHMWSRKSSVYQYALLLIVNHFEEKSN